MRFSLFILLFTVTIAFADTKKFMIHLKTGDKKSGLIKFAWFQWSFNVLRDNMMFSTLRIFY